jgi:hypothetical protein
MRRAAIILILLALVSPALGVERWYYVSATGETCGNGQRDSLSETNGSSVELENVAAPGDSWNVVEARSIASGDWVWYGGFIVGSGGGAGPRVDVTIRRMNSSCVEQEVIATFADIDLTKELSQNVTRTASGVSQINFVSGDILLVECVRTRGTVIIEARYNAVGGGGSNMSYVEHPDEVGAAERRVMRVD